MNRKNGAGERTRTVDSHLGKVALYQLSYARAFSGQRFYFIFNLHKIKSHIEKRAKKNYISLFQQYSQDLTYPIVMQTTYPDITPAFKPFIVGDSIGPYINTYYVSTLAAYISASIAFVLSFCVIWLLTRRMIRKVRRRVLRAALPVAAGVLALAVGTAAHFYYGGPYCYENYRVPDKPSDIVIWFSGSDDGAYGCHYLFSNYYRAIEQFGPNRVALFNFRDIDQAIVYASKLPEGSRLIVRGHSMGGASAVRFAQRFKGEILMLDTRDLTSWFGHIEEKPANVQYWRNIQPEDERLFSTYEEHSSTNYWGSLNMANLFRFLGRPWGIIKGADNVILPRADHHECGNNLMEDSLPNTE